MERILLRSLPMRTVIVLGALLANLALLLPPQGLVVPLDGQRAAYAGEVSATSGAPGTRAAKWLARPLELLFADVLHLPEPTDLLLFGAGLAGLGLVLRRRLLRRTDRVERT